MEITKPQVLNIIKYIEHNPDFYFPFKIICSNFGKNSDLFEVDCLDIGYNDIATSKSMTTFTLVENLQNLHLETIELMAKGFLDKIENTSILDKISNLAAECRNSWKKEWCESKDIEEYGSNEFIGGKADAFEDCVQIIKQEFTESALINRLSKHVITSNLENLSQIYSTREGLEIGSTDAYSWVEIASESSLIEMSNSIIELMDYDFDIDCDEYAYLVAEAIVLRVRKDLD